MASSALFYIAWPVTLGLSFIAGSMILSKNSTTGKSKVSHRNSSPNTSVNKNSAATNLRSSPTRSLASKSAYPESHNIKEIINTNDPKERITKLLKMIDQLGPGDFEQAVADLLKPGPIDFAERGGGIVQIDTNKKRIAEYELLFNAWAKVNPQGALAYAKENSKSTFPISTVLSTWAEYAPDAAIQWVKLNHEGDKASPYLVDVIIGISSTNPERATALINELPLYKDRNEALRAIIPHISKLGAEKAFAWLATLKKGRRGATIALTHSLAKQDPQGTIDMLKKFPAHTQKKDYGQAIASAWAELDINKASEWTSSLEGHVRYNAATKIIGQFASSDPNKAATWMKTMSGDLNYSFLVQQFISSIQRDHPEIALANHEQLSTAHRRHRPKHNILRLWAIQDKGAATQWMQSNNMDPAAQKKVLSAAAKGFGYSDQAGLTSGPQSY